MANPLEYTPIPVTQYDYDPWISEGTKRRWKQAEEAKKKQELQKKHIRWVFKTLVERYDDEMLDKIWKEEFAPRDLLAEFEGRQ